MESLGEDDYRTVDDDDDPRDCNDTIYTIATIQHLGLRFTVDAVNVQNAKILVQAESILQTAVLSQVHSYETLYERVHEAAPCVNIQDMLCTWRPTLCVDIFLFLGPQNMIVVGLPMLAETAKKETSLLSGLAWTRHREHPRDSEGSTCARIADNDISKGNQSRCEALKYQTTFDGGMGRIWYSTSSRR